MAIGKAVSDPNDMIAIAKAIGKFFIPQEYVMAMFFALSKSLLLRKYAKAKRIGKIAIVDARRGGGSIVGTTAPTAGTALVPRKLLYQRLSDLQISSTAIWFFYGFAAVVFGA